MRPQPPADIARDIWIKRHLAGVLQQRAKQLGNKPAARGRISQQIGRLVQQVNRLERKLDRLAVVD